MTIKIGSATIVHRTTDLPFSKLDNEMLAIDATAGYFYSLNESAGRIWELLSQPISVAAICAQLCEEFTVDEKSCLRDAAELLQRLQEAGLVQVNEPQNLLKEEQIGR